MLFVIAMPNNTLNLKSFVYLHVLMVAQQSHSVSHSVSVSFHLMEDGLVPTEIRKSLEKGHFLPGLFLQNFPLVLKHNSMQCII